MSTRNIDQSPTQAMRQRRGLIGCLLPWPFALAAFLLFIVLAWFSMAGMSYDGTHRWAPLKTAGWFSIGFPFTFGMGLLSAVFVALLARKIHKLAAWLALAFLLACVVFVIRAALPEARLAAIIGESAGQSATIERLVIRDSFNEGQTTWGVISGPADLLGLIAKHRSLELTHEAWPDGRLRSFFPELFPELEMHEENPISEAGEAASDKRAVFYRPLGSETIYFWKK